MEKVIKCNGCGLHFMHTEKATECPFCETEYVEIGAKAKEEKAKDKEGTTKTQVEEKAASSAEASAAKKDKKELQKFEKNFPKFGKRNKKRNYY